MNTIKQLQDRFPYMFEGQNIGISIARGWEGLFVHLCEDIDKLLGPDKQGFHWVQVKEKFGSARFYWTMKNRSPSVRVDIISESGVVASLVTRGDGRKPQSLDQEIAALVDKATDMTWEMCIVCGKPGAANDDEPYVLVLCPDHAADRRARKLKPTQIWGDES